MRIIYLLLLAPLLFAIPARAQDAASDRLDQLEQEMMILKRKQERSNAYSAPIGGDNGVGNAQTDMRLSAMEEELRKLRGMVEEKDFEVRRIAEEFEKFKRDAEFRLGALEKTITPAPATEAEPDAAQPIAKPADKAPKKKPDISVKESADAETEEPAAEKTEASIGPGDTSRDHYNYAFRLLNQNQYEEAAKSFAEFSKKYPKDPLVGNAYYWQGETYYIRKNFAGAIDKFRQGFEAMPTGPKAADNLLKLGMSLAALKKNKEACVVLSQVVAKYKTASANVAAKAQAEHKRIGC